VYGWQERAMLSKCANPKCSEIFRYLHKGKIFSLAPTPEVQAVAGMLPALEERFWLCERCSKEMTFVWNGARVRLVALPKKRNRARASAAAAHREDR
jgi:hypothetical protein